MNITPFSILLATLAITPMAVAQTREPVPAPAPTAAPKVHTSKARDVTDCSRGPTGGYKGTAGVLAGAVAGKKLGGGTHGLIAGGMLGGVVGTEMDKKDRCGPGAQIERNAAPEAAPKTKKKFGLGGLRNAVGL